MANGLRCTAWQDSGENREKALEELVEITGNGYFKRRGINDLEIRDKAGLFCMFGSEDDILKQVESWEKEGVDILVFNLASKDLGDYVEQINKLNRMLH